MGSGFVMPRRPSGYFSLTPTQVEPGQEANRPVPCLRKNAATRRAPSRVSMSASTRGSNCCAPSAGSHIGRRAASLPDRPARSHSSMNIAGSMAVSRPSTSRSWPSAFITLYGRALASTRAHIAATGLSSKSTASSAARAKPLFPCAAAVSQAL